MPTRTPWSAISSTLTSWHYRKVHIICQQPYLKKAEECIIEESTSLDDTVFEDTDNGIKKTAETTFFNMDRFRFRLELYNRFQILGKALQCSSTCKTSLTSISRCLAGWPNGYWYCRRRLAIGIHYPSSKCVSHESRDKTVVWTPIRDLYRKRRERYWDSKLLQQSNTCPTTAYTAPVRRMNWVVVPAYTSTINRPSAASTIQTVNVGKQGNPNTKKAGTWIALHRKSASRLVHSTSSWSLADMVMDSLSKAIFVSVAIGKKGAIKDIRLPSSRMNTATPIRTTPSTTLSRSPEVPSCASTQNAQMSSGVCPETRYLH